MIDDLRQLSDDALQLLIREAMHESAVRRDVARIDGTAPCPTMWGPGPPWYCIPRCKTGPAGHAGRCEPNMTEDQADAEWCRLTTAGFSQFSSVREEARRRTNPRRTDEAMSRDSRRA
jgi:hypothetical protein